jgi:hypothetical protein
MARERLTSKTAGDASMGQSANDYWRLRALNAIKGAMSSVEKELLAEAQKVSNEEAAQIGVTPPQYAPTAAPEPALGEAVVGAKEEKKETEMSEDKGKQASTMVFEPRQRSASGPVNPAAIGAQKWREMALKFPQYIKNPALHPTGDPKSMTMLGIPATRYNQAAVQAIVATLGGVAAKLETTDEGSALQLDLVSELLLASVEESEQVEMRLAAASEEEVAEEKAEEKAEDKK